MTAMTKRIWLDFDVIDLRCAQLGALTGPERAKLLDVTQSSLSRWRRGVMDITVGRAAELAALLGLELSEILSDTPKPPSPPPPGPKPPSGPGSPKPPAGPRPREQVR